VSPEKLRKSDTGSLHLYVIFLRVCSFIIWVNWDLKLRPSTSLSALICHHVLFCTKIINNVYGVNKPVTRYRPKRPQGHIGHIWFYSNVSVIAACTFLVFKIYICFIALSNFVFCAAVVQDLLSCVWQFTLLLLSMMSHIVIALRDGWTCRQNYNAIFCNHVTFLSSTDWRTVGFRMGRYWSYKVALLHLTSFVAFLLAFLLVLRFLVIHQK